MSCDKEAREVTGPALRIEIKSLEKKSRGYWERGILLMSSELLRG